MDLPAVHNTINKAAQNITYSNILHRVVVVDSKHEHPYQFCFAVRKQASNFFDHVKYLDSR